MFTKNEARQVLEEFGCTQFQASERRLEYVLANGSRGRLQFTGDAVIESIDDDEVDRHYTLDGLKAHWRDDEYKES